MMRYLVEPSNSPTKNYKRCIKKKKGCINPLYSNHSGSQALRVPRTQQEGKHTEVNSPSSATFPSQSFVNLCLEV